MSLRIKRSIGRPTSRWQTLPIAPRGSTKLGFSFRLPQAKLMRLEPRRALPELLGLGFDVVRLAALWNRIELAPGAFDFADLDWQVHAAARSGAEVIMGLGPIKNFGYPEFYVPAHLLPTAIPEGSLVSADSHPALAAAALDFLGRCVDRYRETTSISAWQVEQEAVDPLGMEHSWRLALGLVAAEVDLVRRLDPTRPILLSGFLPMSVAVQVQQHWRTRDQDDSLAAAMLLGDAVGLDVYPSHALAGAAGWSLYLSASEGGARRRLRSVIGAAVKGDRRVLITEGQAEPWESITNPPNPRAGVAASCPPERLIENYNACLRSAEAAGAHLDAYLLWGAEYWLQRRAGGDDAYMSAVERILRLR